MAIRRRMRIVVALGAAAAAACGIAACGGGGSNTFSGSGMAISFTYPGDLHALHRRIALGHANAAHPTSREVVGINPDNILLVERYKLTIPTMKANMSELEDAADQVVTALFRREMTGTRTQFNGIPAVTYRLGPTGNGTTSQVTYVFIDGSAYELDCQWTAEHKSKIQQACRDMKRTIKPAS
jgi:hypothetical protein